MSDPTSDDPMRRTMTIVNKRGLHARASSRFVKCVDTFECVVVVEKDGMQVPGNSIMGLMLLAATPGSTIDVSAHGKDAQEALDALDALVTDGFGERD